MKVTWIGQAGLIIKCGKLTVMIDPYLSDSVKKINPKNYRRIPVNEELFNIKPDVMIFTHDHLDHYDPETATRFINEDTSVTVLSPSSVWEKVRKLGGDNNYVMFNRNTTWTFGGISFTAVKAEHSDCAAIGCIIDDGSKKIYITGDTLYNESIFEDIPRDIHAMFLPINGVGNNMNMEDARRFSERVNPHITIPFHCGMFDNTDMSEFNCKNRKLLELYKETEV